MAELLNKYFQSVFSPGTPQNNVNYLQPLQIDCISTVKVTEEKIKLILESLCISKSAGSDGISPQVLKNLSPSLTSSIFLLIKTCCNKRLFPSVWKCADVTANHKIGSKNNVENDRPISLLCVISKVFEKLIYDVIDLRIRKEEIATRTIRFHPQTICHLANDFLSVPSLRQLLRGRKRNS